MGTVPVKIIALTQHHRGHGVSSAGFFLGQALTQQNVPVLLADLTNRHTRVQYLNSHFPTKRLVIWSPPTAALRDLRAMLRQMRAEVSGRASCVILDIDQTVLESRGRENAQLGIDFLLLATEYTSEGQKTVDRLAQNYEDLQTRGRIGVAFARVSDGQIGDLPQQTENGQLPILGYWPADYRLAMTDDYIAAGTPPTEPHQPYLSAISLLAQRLIRLVPLTRIEKQAATP